jgi:putative ABC transport system permease protein
MAAKELRYAARTLTKSPIFLITAALTIALGIGASTAIFSVANAVLLRPLPYRDPGNLVIAAVDMRARDVRDNPDSNENFVDLKNGAKTQFEDFAAVGITGRTTVLRDDDTPEQVTVAPVTINFFRLLGAGIALGRDFNEQDGQPQPPPPLPGAPNAANAPRLPAIVILSHGYWMRRYGASPSVLGKTTLNGRAQIVGVLEPGFELFFPPSFNMETPDLWIASRTPYDNAQRTGFFWRPVGRLKPGATLERARAEAEQVGSEIRRNFPLWRTAGYHVRIEQMQQYLVARAKPPILALLGAAIFLLLIACANVGNLLLVRASLRSRELAVRAALGGNRGQLIRQMLVESAMLAGVGTLLGVALAWAGIRELISIAPANLPRLDSIRIDPIVLFFAALAGAASAVVFGVIPAIRASRPNVIELLRGNARTMGLSGGGALRNTAVVVEIALSFVLLMGSGLMFRSFLALQKINVGFDPAHVVTFDLLGGRFGPQPAQRAAFIREIRTRLQSIPGVESVSAASNFPLAGGFFPIRWGLEDALTDASKFRAVDNQEVLPGYFETMHTPLIAGRTFTDLDNAPDQNVAIIDQLLASKAFPNQSAIGKRLLIRVRSPEPEWVQIVGVVAHQRQTELADPGREQIYFTDGFVGHGRVGQWIVRTQGDPSKYGSRIRAEISSLDPHALIAELHPADYWMEHAQAGTRFSLLLIGVFAVIAALLAAVGLYGVLSTVVRQRTAEIGVRMALGAAPANIFALVASHGFRLSAIAIGIGILAAVALTRVMTSMLVGIKATDPLTFLAIAILFFLIAAIASWIPARRAARLDPTVALRDE